GRATPVARHVLGKRMTRDWSRAPPAKNWSDAPPSAPTMSQVGPGRFVLFSFLFLFSCYARVAELAARPHTVRRGRGYIIRLQTQRRGTPQTDLPGRPVCAPAHAFQPGLGRLRARDDRGGVCAAAAAARARDARRRQGGGDPEPAEAAVHPRSAHE